MSSADAFVTVARSLAGVFNNRPQALAEPTWYVQLRLWICPVPHLSVPGQLLFFLEQSSAAFAQAPYRQRLLTLATVEQTLTATYSALTQPQQWQGAAQDRDRLQAMTPRDIVPLPGSTLGIQPHSTPQGSQYLARHQPGERCTFTIDGHPRQVELAFEVWPAHRPHREVDEFWMGDRGYDPDSDKYTWGALHGPFKLQKEQDLSTDLALG